MSTFIEVGDLIRAAHDLASEDGDNTEYDRALVEVVGDALGVLRPETRGVIAAAVLHNDPIAVGILSLDYTADQIETFLGRVRKA